MKTNEALTLINDTILSLKPYHLTPVEATVKLNQNENPFDWPDEIKQEIMKFCMERPWNRYPDFIPDELKKALAKYNGVTSKQIIVGNGSNEMLLVLFLALVNKSSNIILCKPTFTVYQMLLDGFGAKGVTINLNEDLQFDIPKIIDTVEKNPKSLLILCSPNNPTGSVIDESGLRSI
ncbi:MAG: aminotransferase class I/II-fold pyridoxal phosphate-dependent enzyme, partial [Fibrobacter sp.]|nr:aminotransferase class I/II-fold pyridoxal phosphate-dependent enzyme [Fibrobacter sp.]